MLLFFAGLTVMYSVLGTIAILAGAVFLINLLQDHYPGVLLPFLRTWDFLPLWMRSLEPADGLVKRISCCSSCCMAQGGGECCEAIQQTCQEVRRDVEAAAAAAPSDPEKESLMCQTKNDLKDGSGGNNNLAAFTLIPRSGELPSAAAAAASTSPV